MGTAFILWSLVIYPYLKTELAVPYINDLN